MWKMAFGKRFLPALLCLVLLFSCGLGVSAVSEEHTVITLDNTSPGTDVNPVIRFFLSREMGFGSGGPFTVKFEWKIDNFKRMNTSDKPWAFVHFLALDSMTSADEGFVKTETSKGTDGWIEAKGLDGKNITFENVRGINIAGNIQPYAILEIGLYMAKGTLSIRNFRVENAAGKVVYSLDDDQDVNELMKYAEKEGLGRCSLKDIGQINTEPAVLATGFGDNTATVTVSKSTDEVVTTSTTAGLVFEDDPTTQTPSSQTAAPPVTEEPTTAGETTGTTDTTDTTNTTDSTTDTGGSTDTTQATTARSTAADPAGVVNGDEPEDKGGLPVGAIIAIVAAAVVVIAAGVVAILAYTGKIKLPFFHKADGDSSDSETKK